MTLNGQIRLLQSKNAIFGQPGMLYAVKIKGHTSSRLSAEAKSTQSFSLEIEGTFTYPVLKDKVLNVVTGQNLTLRDV